MTKNINGYVFDDTTGKKTSSSTFWQAEKGREKYFIKCFDNPKRPSDRVSPAVRKQKNETCDTFAKERKRVLSAIRSCQGGTIVAPVEFFEYDRKFYQATEWRQIRAKSLDEICHFPDATKELLLKTAAQTLKVVHSKGIIHLDVKPDNLPVSVNEVRGNLVCALIDFDSSYFENSLPIPELTAATDPYMSPELAAYKMKNPKYGGMRAVTGKNDVFALAIVFHEYWCGKKFTYRGAESSTNARYLYQAVDDGDPIRVDPCVPDWLENLLRWMIEKQPSDRPSMAEVLEGLKDHSKIRGLKPIPVPPKPVPVPPKPVPVPPKPVPVSPKPVPQRNNGFAKGPNFPSDAISFEQVSNGNIKLIFRDGSKTSYNQAVALRKGIVIKT